MPDTQQWPAATAVPPTASAELLISRNPADGTTIAQYPVHDRASVEGVVVAAQSAAATWTDLGHHGRRRHLQRWASYLATHTDELTEILHTEIGKPRFDAFVEIAFAIEHTVWAAQHAAKVLAARKIGTGPALHLSTTVEYRPLGVVGVIGPWNYPISTPAVSIAYALAAGNTVVFKPSEYATSVGTWFVESFRRANPELPHGILASVSGYGETGSALVGSGVGKISFTGSTATGKKIMATAAATMTPVLLECGGKDAAIVAADADVKSAARAIAFAGLFNSGQTCVGVERVYVERVVRDEFVAELREIAASLHAGPGADASYGPMVLPAQIDIVRQHVADALAKGGTAILGGLDSIKPPYIEPILILDTDENSLAVQEETFGPTLTIRTVDNIDEAIRLANNTKYALSSSVFSKRHGPQLVGCGPGPRGSTTLPVQRWHSAHRSAASANPVSGASTGNLACLNSSGHTRCANSALRCRLWTTC